MDYFSNSFVLHLNFIPCVCVCKNGPQQNLQKLHRMKHKFTRRSSYKLRFHSYFHCVWYVFLFIIHEQTHNWKRLLQSFIPMSLIHNESTKHFHFHNSNIFQSAVIVWESTRLEVGPPSLAQSEKNYLNFPHENCVMKIYWTPRRVYSCVKSKVVTCV